jgi:3-phenylpropionate/trans-cinnamate dioxygenase ferredoxin subunit
MALRFVAEMAAQSTRWLVARVEDVPEGERLIVDVGGRSVGIFNVEGRFYALLNRCPHRGAELCKGDVLDLVVAERPGEVRLERGMKLLACPAHGWEYDMETGQSWIDPHAGRARPVEVRVVEGRTVAGELTDGSTAKGAEGGYYDTKTHLIKGPYTAEVIPVEVEDDYVVLSLSGRPTAREE